MPLLRDEQCFLDALNAIRKAWESGYRDAVWTRQDPDLELLHGNVRSLSSCIRQGDSRESGGLVMFKSKVQGLEIADGRI